LAVLLAVEARKLGEELVLAAMLSQLGLRLVAVAVDVAFRVAVVR